MTNLFAETSGAGTGDVGGAVDLQRRQAEGDSEVHAQQQTGHRGLPFFVFSGNNFNVGFNFIAGDCCDDGAAAVTGRPTDAGAAPPSSSSSAGGSAVPAATGCASSRRCGYGGAGAGSSLAAAAPATSASAGTSRSCAGGARYPDYDQLADEAAVRSTGEKSS